MELEPFDRCSTQSGLIRGPDRRLTKAPQPTDLLFPGNYLKMFNNLLEAQNLKLDRDGKPRTANSLRHTYICLRLMEGADVSTAE